jgi:hypothetical protein
MASTASAAGNALPHSDTCGPINPTASAAPISATATKFTELLIRKKATDRRAIR